MNNWSVGGLACAAGAAGALSPAAPTGHAGVDNVLLAVSIAAVTFVGACAPWWSVAALAAAAAAIAADAVLVGLAAAALAAAVVVGIRLLDGPVPLAVSIGLSLNVLARAELGGSFGGSALVGITAAAIVFVLGFRLQTRTVRRVAWIATGSVAVVTVLAAAGFGFAAAKAREDLSAGVRHAEAAVAALEGGDFDRAAEQFASAADVLERAHGELTSPWAVAASAVPVVGQHRAAAIDMSEAGFTGAAAVAEAIEDIDLDTLRVVDGQIDLGAIAALRDPFIRVHAALDRLGAAVRESRSPWLVNRARIELDDFEVSIAEHLPSLETAITATELAPGMLGADEPQVYLVLFTTPSEARGLGGFVGNYAELTIDDGRFRLSNFGRAQALDRALLDAEARLDGPEGFIARYGRFVLDEDGDGAVGGAAFRTITMTPHFPWVGQTASDLYAQATGRTVDGVIAMDPFVVAKLLAYTGPIELTTVVQQLTADNAASYLLRDQYVVAAGDNERRADVLAEAARVMFGAVLTGSLPEPTVLADDLGPLAAQRRLLIWSPDEDEQELFRRVHMAGEIPAHDGGDGWSVAVSNLGGSKIDAFLQRAASYESRIDPATGDTLATLRLELVNEAPADGLPNYVIGNQIGLPKGTSRLYVSFYSPLALTAATLDGHAAELETGDEEGWNVYSRSVDIPPGGTVRFEVSLAGRVSRPGEIVTWEQPLATPLGALGDS